MNLLPLAALVVALLAFGTAVTALVLADKLRRPRRLSQDQRALRNVQALFDGLPKPRHQIQRGGDGATQVQSGGTLIVPAEVSPSGMEMTIDLSPDPEETARRISARMGRHL